MNSADHVPPHQPSPPIRRVLIQKSDRDGGASLVRHVRAVHPAAECAVVRTIAEARRAWAEGPPDLFITGLEAPDGDVLDLLWGVTGGPRAVRHSLMVTRHGEPWPLLALRGLPVGGAVDSARDAPEMIGEALRAIAAGHRYWSPALQARFAAPGAALQQVRQLAPTERLVFALAGSGRDPKAVAAILGFTTESVASTLKRIHRKLDVHHNGQLVERAARLGFVRFTEGGPVLVGFGLLLADYYVRCKRPLAPTPALCAAYPGATAFAGLRARVRDKFCAV